jgi:hypothetical protein
MRLWFAFAALAVCAHAADPQAAWEQAVQAKGGRERLHAVHSLAVYLRPANVNLAGLPTNWLCVFPDRYFEYARTSSGERALAVDASNDRAGMDITGVKRQTRHVSEGERDQLVLNQVLYLLESAWIEPRPVELKHNVLTVEASGLTFRIWLDRTNLPERLQMLAGQKHKVVDDYHLQHYREFSGIQLPLRVAHSNGLREWTWDADYEVNAKYNPKLFDRVPDLANGPEPWRQR